MKQKVTIHEIARRSGVSLATVSLALNNRPGVSAETRERVLAAANTLGYPIRPEGQVGPCSHLTTLGMLVKVDPDILPQANPFYSKIIMSVEDTCRRNGINLLFASLPVDENNHVVEAPALLNNNQIEGLIVVGAFVDQTILSVSGKNMLPLVLVDGYSDTQRFDAVVSDNFHAAYQAVEYLIHKGHHRIGLVGSSLDSYPSIQERRFGYLRALKDNGIPESFIANFNINNPSHGLDESLALLKEHPQITALFCVNDDSASAVIQAAGSLGRRVPQDISIIGYDDTYIAANTHPKLTTMHVDTLAIGRAAVHLLSMRVEAPDSARMTITIHPWLVERESAVELVAKN